MAGRTSKSRKSTLATSAPLISSSKARAVWICPSCDVQVDGTECDFCGLESLGSRENIPEPAAVKRAGKKKDLVIVSLVSDEDEKEDDDDLVFAEPEPPKKRIRKANQRSQLKPRYSQYNNNGGIWAEKYAPTTEEELGLAVDKDRIERTRLAVAAALRGDGPRLVVLHGPTGCGKSTTVKVLCRSLIVHEWREETGSSDMYSSSSSWSTTKHGGDEMKSTEMGTVVGDEGMLSSFTRFLHACTYKPLMLKTTRHVSSSSSSADTQEQKPTGTISLIESLPIGKNTKTFEAQRVLQAALARLNANPQIPACIVFVLTVEGSSPASPAQLVEALGEENVRMAEIIGFNPIPPKRLANTVQNITHAEGLPTLSSSLLDSFAGDIRAAINHIQLPSKPKNTRGSKPATSNIQAGRDETFELCYAVGKLIRGRKSADQKFEPELVARNCALDPPALAQFVFENFYKYASAGDCGVEAYFELAENLSLSDSLTSSRWDQLEASGGEDEVAMADGLAESVLARSAGCWQKYCAVPLGGSFGKLIPITRPQSYDISRGAREWGQSLRIQLRGNMDTESPMKFVMRTLPFVVSICDDFNTFSTLAAFGGMSQKRSSNRSRSVTQPNVYVDSSKIAKSLVVDDDPLE